jgi:hypothetical protein
MVAAKGMLGLERPDPFLLRVATLIRDNLVPNTSNLGQRSISGPTVKNWFPFIYYKGNDKQKKSDHEVRVKKTRKRSRHWSHNKI